MKSSIVSKYSRPPLPVRRRKPKPIIHKVKPHTRIQRRTVNMGPRTPGPKYNAKLTPICVRAPVATFGKSKRFNTVPGASRRRKSDSHLLKTRKKKLPKLKHHSTFRSHFFTTRAFERYPQMNAGKFSTATRLLGGPGKGKKKLGKGKRDKSPGPGQYNPMNSFRFFHENKTGGCFLHGKRNTFGGKSGSPSPLQYRVKYTSLSIAKKPPSAVFTRGGRDYGYGHIEKNHPGPTSYNSMRSFNYCCQKPKFTRFSKSKKFPKPETPGPSPLNYRPKYDIVLDNPPRATLYLFGD